ncbi:hypothetical protein [Candidatus Magnetobacterium casense]|uniref:Holin n=1 Tax=Candidatus Magnetobacterium casense TaxID=1455061 RepID=A0ABS6RZF9_9BACT|nr:hypothetical protein [Candidatus Magnetobacterium casensis]MBV6342028.1 hypothetical protein [Candidatus Magnetobacterium casensis]
MSIEYSKGNGVEVKDWKTTASAAVAALPGVLSIFGITLTQEQASAIFTVGVFLIGFFARDIKKK